MELPSSEQLPRVSTSMLGTALWYAVHRLSPAAMSPTRQHIRACASNFAWPSPAATLAQALARRLQHRPGACSITWMLATNQPQSHQTELPSSEQLPQSEHQSAGHSTVACRPQAESSWESS